MSLKFRKNVNCHVTGIGGQPKYRTGSPKTGVTELSRQCSLSCYWNWRPYNLKTGLVSTKRCEWTFSTMSALTVFTCWLLTLTLTLLSLLSTFLKIMFWKSESICNPKWDIISETYTRKGSLSWSKMILSGNTLVQFDKHQEQSLRYWKA